MEDIYDIDLPLLDSQEINDVSIIIMLRNERYNVCFDERFCIMFNEMRRTNKMKSFFFKRCTQSCFAHIWVLHKIRNNNIYYDSDKNMKC